MKDETGGKGTGRLKEGGCMDGWRDGGAEEKGGRGTCRERKGVWEPEMERKR